jgi:hypothetical protein
MRRLLAIVLLPFSFCCASSLAGQSHPAPTVLRTNPALEQFKSLAGEWDGKDSYGVAMHLTYEVQGSGVVMEKLEPQGEPSMVTMYSLDSDHILAIHFCSAGNQPILRTGPLSAASGKYDFTLERAYGMQSPDELHMVGLVVTITDKDHLSQVWSILDHGKRSTNTINFVRKRG